MSGPLLSRRLFLADLGRGSFAIALLGLAGCGSSGSSGSTPPSARASAGGPSAAASTVPTGSGGAPSAATGSGTPGGSGGTTWTRVNLGFVSAYVLVRGGGEAAIVDTGVAGSEDEIATALQGIGLGWANVGHVILTHKHGDHAGSASAILTAATTAAGYIGTADLAAVQAPRALSPLEDGDTVMGLRIIATPGHTAGHVAVLDETAGVLVAGDALGTRGGPLTGSNPSFTEDAAAAQASIVKMGNLTFETLLVGHGEPILTGAAAQVKALAG